jgi:hypothetical protein
VYKCLFFRFAIVQGVYSATNVFELQPRKVNPPTPNSFWQGHDIAANVHTLSRSRWITQGCQMVCFQTKIRNLGKFLEGLRMENVDIFFGHLE